jgi:hypothetical protein
VIFKGVAYKKKKNCFVEKKLAKNGVFAQNTASLCKKMTITLVFEENDHFFGENWRKRSKC